MDESGDLGWKFEAPYQKGGSSRFFTITSLVVHERDRHRPERVMKDLREYLNKTIENFKPSDEIKSTSLRPDDRIKFAELFNREASKSKFMKVYSKTVKKENVTRVTFKEDPNVLYNYLTSLGILEKIKDFDEVILYADARVTSTDAKMGFEKYLLTKLAGDLNSDCKLSITHVDSRHSKHVQCADILANIIWRKYEFPETVWCFEKIQALVSDGTLFF